MSTLPPTSQPDDATEVSRLVEFLSDRDAPCPLCGYNLRGLTTDICPECGRQLQLTVGLTEPFLRAWIILSAATFTAAGIGILFIIALIQANSAPPAEILLPMLYFLLALPAAVATVVFRRRFLRLPRVNQLVFAWAMAVATALAIAYLVHAFR